MSIKRNYTIGVIPARKGSVGIVDKNLLNLGEENLIQRSIESALESNLFDQIILSTDYDLSDIGELDSKVKLHSRSLMAATSDATSNDVLFDIFGKLPKKILDLNPIIVYLQPTSVFRRGGHIFQAMEHFNDSESTSLVSVCSHPIQGNKLLRMNKNNLLESFEAENLVSSNRARSESLYYPNGAIYIFRYSTFIERGTFPIDLAIPFMMDWVSSLDIDDAFDFESAKEIWRLQNE